MGFSKEWNEIYINNQQLSIWPWDEVIALTHRNFKQKDNMVVLELGCGAGANIPFFASIGAKYYAIEGSAHIVERLQNSFKSDKIHITCGDFTKGFGFEEIIGRVDLIIDRSAVTHNSTKSIKSVVKLANQYLKPGGKYMAFDWFATDCDTYKNDEKIKIDDNTFVFNSGYFAGLGNVHFSTPEHIKELFAKFSLDYLINNVKEQLQPEPKHSSSYTFIATKPL